MDKKLVDAAIAVQGCVLSRGGEVRDIMYRRYRVAYLNSGVGGKVPDLDLAIGFAHGFLAEMIEKSGFFAKLKEDLRYRILLAMGTDIAYFFFSENEAEFNARFNERWYWT